MYGLQELTLVHHLIISNVHEVNEYSKDMNS